MLRDKHFRLITLGRLTLVGATGDEDTSLAKRRFKLALLAVLAMARRPVPRDTLLGMFWPEQDEARARHSLSNALSSLRRALGQRAITTRDSTVALAPEAGLGVDALDLTEAAEAQDSARAVELYGGPFLDGVHVDDSPAFEQWVSRERRRLETVFIKECARQCASLARARRWAECHALAARWLDAEPLSADAALFLINATKAEGTRAALVDALDEYDRLKARLSRDFELVPEPPVRELAARIREQLAAMSPSSAGNVTAETPVPLVSAHVALQAFSPAIPAAVSPASSDRALPDAGSPPRTPAVSGDESGTTPVGPWSRTRAMWAPLRVLAVSAIGLFALAGAVLGAKRSNGVHPGDPRKPVIAVLTLHVRSDDSTIAWLADGLPEMITGKLARIGAVEVVPQARVRAVIVRRGEAWRGAFDDAVARDLALRVGATIEAHGTLARDGANLVLDLAIHDVGTGGLAHSAVLTRANALAMADEAAARILNAADVTIPGPHLAELETSSVEAYEHYMRALEVGKAGRLSEYKRELDAAIALDSGFIAVVRARLNAAISSNDTALTRRLRETMARHADRATEFDRMHQDTQDAFVSGERERSQALARGLVRRYPRDPRAHQLLHSILNSHGEFAEAERDAIRALALDSLAMEAGAGPCTPCLGFSTIVSGRWLAGDYRSAAEWARRWIRTQPDGAWAWAALAWSFSYMHRPDSALPSMQRALSLSGGELWATAEFARMLVVARRYETADSVVATMEARSAADWRETAFDLRAVLERERGQLRAASRTIGRLTNEFPGAAGFGDMVHADNLRLLGDHAEAARRFEAPAHTRFRTSVPVPLPSTEARAFCWHHALAADAYAPTGDTLRLRATADTLEAGCARSFYGRDWRLHHHVRGLVALQGGRYADAERELTLAKWTPAEGWVRTTVELAKAQRALGRPRDAVATLRSGYATRLDAMGRYVPISELDYWMAQAFSEAGEADSARVYAGYVRTAWRD
ncbi:MAG TPA: BTAD domain-containing putative transcriptional regulator, partial [Gemmatimonadaceae bacterium]|nr:BTAD domain-containing putative transcriptional regulator [Gemmatimonadaceae bacterium]